MKAKEVFKKIGKGKPAKFVSRLVLEALQDVT